MVKNLLQKIDDVLETELSNSDFNVTIFAAKVGMSRQHLNRKLRKLTGCTVQQLIRIRRIKRAVQLFQQQAGNVTEVCYEVGFRNPAYFAKCFRDLVGKSPREYMLDSQRASSPPNFKNVP